MSLTNCNIRQMYISLSLLITLSSTLSLSLSLSISHTHTLCLVHSLTCTPAYSAHCTLHVHQTHCMQVTEIKNNTEAHTKQSGYLNMQLSSDVTSESKHNHSSLAILAQNH